MAHLKFYRNATIGGSDGIEITAAEALSIFTPDPIGLASPELPYTWGFYYPNVLIGFAQLFVRMDPGYKALSLSIAVRNKTVGQIVGVGEGQARNSSVGIPYSQIILSPVEYDAYLKSTTYNNTRPGVSASISLLPPNINGIILVSAWGMESEKGQDFNDFELVASYTEEAV